MLDAAAHIIRELHVAFPAVRTRPFWPIVNSEQGDEPRRIATAFADKEDWTKLRPNWLDEVPDGMGSALSFLSDEAICFYIPAYIVADLNGLLVRATPLFHLTHGFDSVSRDQRIWPRRSETWTDYATERWAHLTQMQSLAVVHYLEWRAAKDPFNVEDDVVEALSSFWYERASGR